MKLIEEKCQDKKKYKILLLTNRDSDNIGDQVIEACDISLISAVMNNLNMDDSDFEIRSREAAIVTSRYVETRDPKLLNKARKAIMDCDLIIFGGAPMFNFEFQNFYEKTAVTLELAREYSKPVIFSAIGIEGYDDNNKKCQRLKKTLNFDCVEQITTRDDFEKLQKYVESDHVVTGKVSDPAVFTSKVFENFRFKKQGEKKKIGIFVLRSTGFSDNGIAFSKDESAVFWAELVRELEKRGFDYELMTSGHCRDEAFLDYMIRKYHISDKKCTFNMNYPEQLVQKIQSCDAVISCRLHPSIISFSLDVPSLGIVWNTKVKGFYDSIGYGDRMIRVEDMTPENVAQKVEQMIDQGVNKDKDYLMSVYRYLFDGIRKALCPDNRTEPYSYEELLRSIPVYEGTSEKEKNVKLRRKFRRIYKVYNDCFEKMLRYHRMSGKSGSGFVCDTGKQYYVNYHCGAPADEITYHYGTENGVMITTPKGTWEYEYKIPVKNGVPVKLRKNCFERKGYRFAGWNGRITAKKKTYWFCNDGGFHITRDIQIDSNLQKHLFEDCETIYNLPISNEMGKVPLVMEAVWELSE